MRVRSECGASARILSGIPPAPWLVRGGLHRSHPCSRQYTLDHMVGCEKGPKLGFKYLPTSKTSHCVHGIPKDYVAISISPCYGGLRHMEKHPREPGAQAKAQAEDVRAREQGMARHNIIHCKACGYPKPKCSCEYAVAPVWAICVPHVDETGVHNDDFAILRVVCPLQSFAVRYIPLYTLLRSFIQAPLHGTPPSTRMHGVDENNSVLTVMDFWPLSGDSEAVKTNQYRISLRSELWRTCACVPAAPGSFSSPNLRRVKNAAVPFFCWVLLVAAAFVAS